MNNHGLTKDEEKDFDEKFKHSQFVDYSSIKSFIAQLLHKREGAVKKEIYTDIIDHNFSKLFKNMKKYR